MPARKVEQLGMDEKVVENPAVEALLEERQKRRDSLGAVRATYTEAHGAAMKGLTDLGLKDGMVLRIGRFRITQQPVAERSVSFEVTQSHRVRIELSE